MMTYAARLEKLQNMMRRAQLDAVAIVPGANFVYLTGNHFVTSKRPLIAFFFPNAKPALIAPILELTRINDLDSYQLFSYSDAEGYIPVFERACNALGLAGKHIGVEGFTLRVLESELIQRYAPGCTLEFTTETLMPLRLHKGEDEVAKMRRAIDISQKALDQVLAEIHLGMTEKQVETMLHEAMQQGGSTGLAFISEILSGPNSALPHGSASDRKLQRGDLVLFDFGASFEDYPADITRVVAIGSLDDELRKIYETVKAANAAAIQIAKPGVAAQELDRAARKVIEDAGYGQYFTHRTGHGLGLEVHEDPYIREGNTQLLEPGMIFTIEPGIYIDGRGGVRIEDNLLVTDTGVDVLTTYPRDLRIIGQ